MVWIIVAIAGWGAVHSWLASLSVKAFVRLRMGEGAGRGYRLGYNVFSVVTFAPILLLVGLLPDRILYSVEAPWRYALIAVQVLAVVLAVVTLLQTDAASFAGLRQLVQGEGPVQLVTNGFYRWVRHPLYLFGLLFLWCTPVMTANMLAAYLGLTVYLVVGAIFEERKLMREFGAAYSEYRARTPMILPLPGLSKRGG